jgi:osmotically-inducible protein OsmY
MQKLRLYLTLIGSLAVGTFAGCSTTPPKAPDVTDNIRHSLDQAGLKDVSVKQDRDRGVVTLSGHVPSDGDKAQAEAAAKSFAGPQVVANEIAVVPPGAEKDAKAVNTALDKGIEHNLDAALIHNRLKENVNFEVKSAVVTLTGEVDSQSRRVMAEKVAAGVPYVNQVVNEIQVKNQKATSTR